MFKNLKVRTALYALIGGAMLCIVGMLIAVEFLSLLEQDQKQEQEMISELRHEVADLDALLLQARRAEKDFLLRLSDKYVQKHADLMAKAHHDLELITQTGTDLHMGEELAGVEIANQLLLRYEASFAELVGIKQDLGMTPAEGQEGELRKTVHIIEEEINKIDNPTLLAKVLMMRRHEKDFLLRKDQKYVDRLSARVEEFQAMPSEMFGQPQVATHIKALALEYEAAFLKLVELSFEDLKLRKGLSATYAEFVPIYQDLAMVLEASVQDRLLAEEAARGAFFMGILGTAGAALVLYFILGMRLSVALTRPLNFCSTALHALSEGDATEEPAKVRSRFSEINRLSDALGVLVTKDGERRALEEEVRLANENQKHVVEQMENGLRRFAKGDLTQTIDQPFDEKYETLRNNFNQTIRTLVDIIGAVVRNSEKIQSSSEGITQSSFDLSKRTEGQAATLEETAAALDDLTRSVQAAATGAKEVEGIVASANQTAEESGDVVREAVNAMTMIEKSSGKISQIISVIDDISFQTNLLALNAGVEAARAGEAGRGFAVVASEVRALAQRSSDSAQEIKQLISDSTQQVTHGVDLVGRTGDELLKIIDSIGTVSTHVAQIAEGATEQSNALSEINAGVLQLDQVTQHNAAMVEEATTSSKLLNSDAEALVQRVAVFQINSAADAQTVEWDKDAQLDQPEIKRQA